MNHPTAVSEESSKKRGRPPAFSAKLEQLYRGYGFFDEGDTRRTNLNTIYVNRAFKVLALGDDLDDLSGPFGWLVIRETGKLRRTILGELGRILHPDDMREVATYICTVKPKARDAVVMIRGWRTGKPDREPDVDQLTSELLRQVDDYRVRVPATDWWQVLRAIDNARDAVAEIACSTDDDEATA